MASLDIFSISFILLQLLDGTLVIRGASGVSLELTDVEVCVPGFRLLENQAVRVSDFHRCDLDVTGQWGNLAVGAVAGRGFRCAANLLENAGLPSATK